MSLTKKANTATTATRHPTTIISMITKLVESLSLLAVPKGWYLIDNKSVEYSGLRGQRFTASFNIILSNLFCSMPSSPRTSTKKLPALLLATSVTLSEASAVDHKSASSCKPGLVHSAQVILRFNYFMDKSISSNAAVGCTPSTLTPYSSKRGGGMVASQQSKLNKSPTGNAANLYSDILKRAVRTRLIVWKLALTSKSFLIVSAGNE